MRSTSTLTLRSVRSGHDRVVAHDPIFALLRKARLGHAARDLAQFADVGHCFNRGELPSGVGLSTSELALIVHILQ